jgi:hypothetical protein
MLILLMKLKILLNKLLSQKKLALLIALLVVTPIVIAYPDSFIYFSGIALIVFILYITRLLFKFLNEKFSNSKLIKIPFTLMISSIVLLIIFLELGNFFSIGQLINYFYACQDDPMNSFLIHCYNIYDIYAFLALIGISIVSLTTTIATATYCILKRRRISRKTL